MPPTKGAPAADDAGSGSALFFAGTSTSRAGIDLPDLVAAPWSPEVRAFDSTNLAATYQVRPDRTSAPLRLGNLSEVKDDLAQGKGRRDLAALLWWTSDGQIRYVPRPIEGNGGDGVPAQVFVAGYLSRERLEADVQQTLQQSRRAGHHGTALPRARLAIVAAAVASTTGRALIPLLASCLAKPGAQKPDKRLFLLSLAGLPQPSTTQAEEQYARTVALLQELSAIEQDIRATIGAYVLRGTSTVPGEALSLLTFPGNLADGILLIEPGKAGLTSEREARAWLRVLLSLLCVRAPNTAALAFYQDMERWGEPMKRTSPNGYPALFSSVGFATVEFDPAAEARFLAECDAAELLQAASDQAELTLSQELRDDLQVSGLRAELGQVVDPDGRAEFHDGPILDTTDATYEGIIGQVERESAADDAPTGAIGRMASTRSAAHARALDWVRQHLAAQSNRNPFTLPEALHAAIRTLGDEALMLRREAATQEGAAAELLDQEARGLAGAAPGVVRARLTALAGQFEAYHLARRAAVRDRYIAGGFEYAARVVEQARDDPEGPAAIIREIRRNLQPGFRLGTARANLLAGSDAGASVAGRTLLNGKLRDELYQKQQLAILDDGNPSFDLLGQILDRDHLTSLVLQQLSPLREERLKANRPGGALRVAAQFIEGVADGLAKEHHRCLETFPSLVAILDHLGPTAASRLEDAYRWAWDTSVPPVAVRQAEAHGVRPPVAYAYLEVDSDPVLRRLDSLRDSSVTTTVGRCPGLPLRMVVLRALVGIPLDLLESFGPNSHGWNAYEELQRPWASRTGSWPVHTCPALEALAQHLTAHANGATAAGGRAQAAVEQPPSSQPTSEPAAAVSLDGAEQV